MKNDNKVISLGTSPRIKYATAWNVILTTYGKKAMNVKIYHLKLFVEI